MRIIVMFDLPVLTASQRKSANKFRREIKKAGYMMMQESIYCKMVTNSTAADTSIDFVKKIKPKEGLIQILTITEKQFSRIQCILGEAKHDVLMTDERVTFL